MLIQTLLADYTDRLWFPIDASSFATSVDSVYDWILYICLAFFIPMMAAMGWFMYRYKKPRGTKAESQLSHHTALELTWSIGPSVLLVWMFVAGSVGYLDMRNAPEGSYEVDVQAFKWGWLFDYGGGAIHPELHLVKDEPTKLTMRSEDVIHSLFVPAFRAKKDIVPGRYNYMWFKPTVASQKLSEAELEKLKLQRQGDDIWDYDRRETGADGQKRQFTPEGYTFFDLYCTEYCGKNHSEMQTAVVVHESQADLDLWIESIRIRDPETPQSEWGETLYKQRGCAGCHSVDGTKMTGPSFLNLYGSQHGLTSGDQVTVDENYVRESILYPKAKIVEGYQPVMPSYKGQVVR